MERKAIVRKEAMIGELIKSRFLRSNGLSIGKKILLMAVMSASFSLWAACSIFIVVDRAKDRRHITTKLKDLFRLLDGKIAGALRSGDPGKVQGLLDSLNDNPGLIQARV